MRSSTAASRLETRRTRFVGFVMTCIQLTASIGFGLTLTGRRKILFAWDDRSMSSYDDDADPLTWEMAPTAQETLLAKIRARLKRHDGLPADWWPVGYDPTHRPLSPRRVVVV